MLVLLLSDINNGLLLEFCRTQTGSNTNNKITFCLAFNVIPCVVCVPHWNQNANVYWSDLGSQCTKTEFYFRLTAGTHDLDYIAIGY